MKHGNRKSSKTGGFILGQESLSGGLVYQFICQCCHFAQHFTFLKWLKGQNARISSWVSAIKHCFFLINPLKAKTRKSGIAKNLDASTHMFRSPTIYHWYIPLSSFNPLKKKNISKTGWWFGTWMLFFHIIIGNNHHPNWLSYFSEGYTYTTNQYLTAVRFPQFLWVTSNNWDAHGAAGHRRARRGLGQLALRTQKCRRDTNRGCIPLW